MAGDVGPQVDPLAMQQLLPLVEPPVAERRGVAVAKATQLRAHALRRRPGLLHRHVQWGVCAGIRGVESLRGRVEAAAAPVGRVWFTT